MSNFKAKIKKREMSNFKAKIKKLSLFLNNFLELDCLFTFFTDIKTLEKVIFDCHLPYRRNS